MVEMFSTNEVDNNLEAINKTPFDYKKLRGLIKEKYDTQSVFAKAMGLSNVSISNKLNNNVEWKQEEIEKAIVVLDIAHSDIHSYFFTHIIEKNST